MAEENIMFIEEFRWAKPCNACGKMIGEKSQGWMDKTNRPSKYYHVTCFKPPSGTIQLNNKSTLDEAWIEENLDWMIDRAELLSSTSKLNSSSVVSIVKEAGRQRFSLRMSEKIKADKKG